MKLEATKFRPREVVRHVLQTAAASLQRILILEGHVADDVPVEVIAFTAYCYLCLQTITRSRRMLNDVLLAMFLPLC